uniref:Uncharacterized protein n=1 Tax=Acrobeloides nanus TaxID=290746 RepID=A0A914CFY9_9BILA
MRLLTVLCFLWLSVGVFARHFPLKVKNVADFNYVATPCSSNTSSAWLDIILLIDNSATMGNASLRQIGLSLSSEFSQYTIGPYGSSASRVAIVTYNAGANLIGDFNALSTIQKITAALTSIRQTNVVQIEYGLYDALEIARDMAQLAYEQCTSENGFYHQPNPAAVVLFGAQAPFVDSIDKITQVANQLKSWANLITVNYNVNSVDLTNFLNSIATPYMNLSVSKTLYDDLEFNLMQTNCFCDFGPQLSAFDPVKNRVVKYAECSYNSEELGLTWGTAEALCNSYQSNVVLAPLTSSLRYNFTVSIYQNALPGFMVDPIYIGLHRNSRKAWVWYDYDGSEIPDSGSFSNWAPGYGFNSTGDCVAIQGGNAEKSSSYLWINAACNITTTNIDNARCGYHACDASNMYQSALAGLNHRCVIFESDVKKKKAFEARRKLLKETRKNKNKA